MRRILFTIAATVLVTILVLTAIDRKVHAQGASVLQISGTYSAHTACTTTPSQTTICLASDGLWLSLNGSAFAQVGGVVPVGVTSINGKTGAVTISATTTIN